MSDIQGKYPLELNFVDDRLFLNFWDWFAGNDVVAEINSKGELGINGKVVTFMEYIELVKKSIAERKL